VLGNKDGSPLINSYT